MAVTFNPNPGDPHSIDTLPTGALVVDADDRVFMLVRVPGGSLNAPRFVRLSSPPGYLDADITAPIRPYAGEVTIEND